MYYPLSSTICLSKSRSLRRVWQSIGPILLSSLLPKKVKLYWNKVRYRHDTSMVLISTDVSYCKFKPYLSQDWAGVLKPSDERLIKHCKCYSNCYIYVLASSNPFFINNYTVLVSTKYSCTELKLIIKT
jgi:hypothetical protein